MSALCIVLLMIVISADKSCNSGYGQVFFTMLLYDLYIHTKDPAVELLSDEDTGRITLPFSLDFLCRFFIGGYRPNY